MNKQTTLTIDFGTSRTKVAYFDELQNRPVLVEIGRNVRTMIPSAFYVPLPVDGKIVESEILVGDDAENMLDEDPDGYVIALKKEIHKSGFKHLNNNRKIERAELAATLFRYIKNYTQSNVPYFIDTEIDSCILTVPVNLSTIQRDAICKTAEQGNFRYIKVVEEPIAAACTWLAETRKNGVEYVIVCDIGGGTTDFATVECKNENIQLAPEILTKGFNWGGDDLDERIIERLQDTDDSNKENEQNFWQNITNWRSAFKTKIRNIKEFLTKQKKELYTAKVKNVELPIPQKIIMSCVNDFIDEICCELDVYLKECYDKLNRRDIPVLLVGGSSQLCGLEEKIKTLAGEKNVYRWANSEYATVLGATLDKQKYMKTLFDTNNKNVTNPKNILPKKSNELKQEQKIDQSEINEVNQKMLEFRDHVDAIKHFYVAAELGNLGILYTPGHCYPKMKNLDEAIKWYCKAAEQGNITAQMHVGMLLMARNSQNDIADADKWFSKFMQSADKHNIEHQFGIGLCHDLGLGGVIQNAIEAYRWYQKAAKQGDNESQVLVGKYFFKVRWLFPAAVKCFRRAAEQNCSSGQLALGRCYELGIDGLDNPQEAFNLYNKAAESGDTSAMVAVGRCYYVGSGVTKDPVKGIEWYRKAAELDNAEGQNDLALMYLRDIGIQKNEREAIKWCRKAADKGYPMALTNMGTFYLHGTGVVRNYIEAIKWFQKAIELGEPSAYYHVGCAYLYGYGVLKDTREAAKYFHIAAESGRADAQYELGLCYLHGIGVEVDVNEAHKWIRYSSNACYELAMMLEMGSILVETPISKDNSERVRQLVEAGFNINMQDEVTTPLYLLLENGGTITDIQLLFSLGADPNVQTPTGETPLHFVVRNDSNYDRIRYLIENGANPYIHNNDKKTAIDLANERPDVSEDIIKILTQQK
ncbi:MAG: Hsp70 family protein [Planctomycetaceae bacterium]|jgi:TPR repeat protein/actin-like ATPase involved in cell morphogenesis|nr:Hsp70 family protein [Planctomycetaceae bacterium]